MTIPDQLDQLARMGMAIPDRDWASHCLRHVGYHRLSRYWQPFEAQSASRRGSLILEGTSFDDVMAHYNFDGQLRSTLAHALGHIEVSVRGIWADRLATQGGAQAHLRTGLFIGYKYQEKLDELRQNYRRIAEDSSSAWDDATIWEITEAMSFGQLSRWYNDISERRVRNAIAGTYQTSYAIFSSLLFNLAHLRNICAHHGRLWNRHLYTGLRIPRALAPYCNAAARDRLYNRLVIVAFLMGMVDPRGSWKSGLVELVQAHTVVSQGRMGFPSGWRRMPFWHV